MKLIGSLSSLLVAAMAGNLVPVPSVAQPAIEPTPFTVASGLEGPRGLRFGPDGYLYVAEAGTGGKNQYSGSVHASSYTAWSRYRRMDRRESPK